jgi:hypothetical protein
VTVTVGSVADLLENLRPEIEAQLKPNLEGIFGGVIRRYLPQAWAFKTDVETVTLHVDPDGHVSVRSGGSPNPDVLVKGSSAALSAALSLRNPAMVPAGSIEATSLTSKGQMAFQFLRSRFGV